MTTADAAPRGFLLAKLRMVPNASIPCARLSMGCRTRASLCLEPLLLKTRLAITNSGIQPSVKKVNQQIGY